jgi:hypothetical protein
MRIHNIAYSLIGIYSEKTGSSDKWRKLYFTWEQRTDNNGLIFKYCIYIKLQRGIFKIPQFVDFPDISPSGMSDHFIPYRKDKTSIVGKYSGRVLTLVSTVDYLRENVTLIVIMSIWFHLPIIDIRLYVPTS